MCIANSWRTSWKTASVTTSSFGFDGVFVLFPVDTIRRVSDDVVEVFVVELVVTERAVLRVFTTTAFYKVGVLALYRMSDLATA